METVDFKLISYSENFNFKYAILKENQAILLKVNTACRILRSRPKFLQRRPVAAHLTPDAVTLDGGTTYFCALFAGATSPPPFAFCADANSASSKTSLALQFGITKEKFFCSITFKNITIIWLLMKIKTMNLPLHHTPIIWLCSINRYVSTHMCRCRIWVYSAVTINSVVTVLSGWDMQSMQWLHIVRINDNSRYLPYVLPKPWIYMPSHTIHNSFFLYHCITFLFLYVQ